VWQRWLAHDPVRMVGEPAHAEALRALRLLFLDCGTKDEYHLDCGLRLFRSRLDALGIPAVVEEFDDDHRSVSYRYDVSIPKLLQALRPEA
jgi:enterochelin esterase family protein